MFSGLKQHHKHLLFMMENGLFSLFMTDAETDQVCS